MKSTFIVFINDKVWLRYTRRPHFTGLSNFGDLIIVEYPLTLLSKKFLLHPIQEIKHYRKYSSGIRTDQLSGARIIRPIIIFPSTINLKLLDFINNKFVLSAISKLGNKDSSKFVFLTYFNQLWLKLKESNTKYILDMNDEWSLFYSDEKQRNKIEERIKEAVLNVDYVTCVTKRLRDQYNINRNCKFVPNAVDIHHYVPSFDIDTLKKQESALVFEKRFLKINNQDVSQYSKSSVVFNGIKRPAVGSISGLSETWTGYKFPKLVEELLPKKFSMISSGNIHKPTKEEFILEYEQYIKKTRTNYLGHLDYSLLPDFLKNIDIGLVYYRNSKLNQYAAPNKIWAYLAMGLPVVSINFLTEADKELYEDYVNFTNSPEEFVESIIKLYETDNSELRTKRRQFAIKNSTLFRAKKVIEIIKS